MLKAMTLPKRENCKVLNMYPVCEQSWIMMEEGLEQYVRAERVAKARISGRSVSETPLAFIKPDGIPAAAEPNLLENVVSTVSFWVCRSLYTIPLPDWLGQKAS